ncbi:kinase-like domain-containing protein [Glomus cerebriforme]|uniref:Kinase-like domain-containing protein n=1 Tax=Glomus cerebriforme TaxID=658196 RepID=A0A397TL92_9GLOM|nr:kinase-like domain-containing protein [Glomus cerebriforme]
MPKRDGKWFSRENYTSRGKFIQCDVNPEIFSSKQEDKCPKCKKLREEWFWCRFCEIKEFKEKKWTSGNKDIDELIKESQIKATKFWNFIEWIPSESIEKHDLIGKGGFASVYAATWINGPRIKPSITDDGTVNIVRAERWPVALKRLNKISKNFLKEVKTHIELKNDYIVRCFGITKDPESEDYMMVTDYVENGDLRKYLQNNFRNLTWKSKIEMLLEIAKGLKTIHDSGYLHRDLHAGNILPDRIVQIADLGLSGPADLIIPENQLCGVIPYMAPETLRKATYSKSTDVYSFSMLMWEMASNKRPFATRSHGTYLILNIAEGLRPTIPPNIPKVYKDLMVECWDQVPSKRPTVDKLIKRLETFLNNICWHSTPKIALQFDHAERCRLESLTNEIENDSTHLHPEAFYDSRNLSQYSLLDNDESKLIVNDVNDVDSKHYHSEDLSNIDGAIYLEVDNSTNTHSVELISMSRGLSETN